MEEVYVVKETMDGTIYGVYSSRTVAIEKACLMADDDHRLMGELNNRWRIEHWLVDRGLLSDIPVNYKKTPTTWRAIVTP